VPAAHSDVSPKAQDDPGEHAMHVVELLPGW
jgi:hypothetical protein